MPESLYKVLARTWDVPPPLVDLAVRAERLTAGRRAYLRELEDRAFLRVLKAFQDAGVTEGHLSGTTGYGYGDLGRESLDRIYASLFGAEAALVRLQIISGTHAVSLALRACVRPGDVLVSGTGRPYDTLRPQIEELQAQGSRYLEVPLGREGSADPEAVARAIGEAAIVIAAGRGSRTRGRVCLFLQRSRGYEQVPSRSVGLLERITALAREEAGAAGVEIVTVVDNCYGEFVEDREPTAAGADLAAGSLIKNPGGGLAPAGGYVAGRSELVARAAEYLTAPGLGGLAGPTMGLGRYLYQGLFLAPRAVGAALAGATFAAAFLESAGLPVSPRWDEERTDIIQSVVLGSREAILAFARGIQAAAPIDSRARPEPDRLPGYEGEVVMAAGTFVQGASIEMSLDAPLREPYAAYLQGGLYESHLKVAVLLGAVELWREGHIGVVVAPNSE
ncbi:MAG: hypothetical protein C4551_08840 [Bacillota bacterium]|nr:MAG: hypothetical protein C4551_08840 [Bacillota bacterium]